MPPNGLPDDADEDWRFTNISALAQTPSRWPHSECWGEGSAGRFGASDSLATAFFVNGLSRRSFRVFPLCQGRKAGSLRCGYERPATVEQHLAPLM